MWFKIVISLCLVVKYGENASIQNTLYGRPGTGKQLFVKKYPEVENFQSHIYEVYAEPFNYDLRAASAVAMIQGEGESAAKGEIVFYQSHPPTGLISVKGNLTDLPAGKHGLHIHQSGDLRHGCEKLGPHFNPHLLQHGGPRDPIRHVGDLGNIEVGEDGTAEFTIDDPMLTLFGGPRSIIGRSIVISANADDLGRGGTVDSSVNGDSGKPLACGVIAFIK